MTYITKFSTTTEDEWAKYYESQGWGGGGAVDPVSKAFGWATHARFYFEMEAWCLFIDSVFPDWFPVGEVQNFLISIVKFIYNHEAQSSYYQGLNEGRSIMHHVDGVIDWAKNQITAAVTDMYNRVDREIVAPVKAKADQIRHDLDVAQTNLNDAIAKAGQALQISNSAQAIAGDARSAVNSVQNQVKGFESKLSTLDSQASALDNRIKDASTQLAAHQRDIDDVIRRLKTLENKKSDQTNPLSIGGLFK
jgi:uncharacterized coiled-coil protein SlyX